MNARKWKVIAPLAMTAAGALAAGVATLMKKTQTEPANASRPAAPAPSAQNKLLVVGTYSFISGFQDAATVELSVKYDPETTSFAVVGEDFLSYSSASHVAVIYGEDFDAQIEYAPYYAGEDFSAFCKTAEEKFNAYAPARYASLSGIRYRDGDTMVLCFPIPGDAHSYVQIILFKHKDNDDPLETIPDSASVKALLDTAVIEVHA